MKKTRVLSTIFHHSAVVLLVPNTHVYVLGGNVLPWPGEYQKIGVPYWKGSAQKQLSLKYMCTCEKSMVHRVGDLLMTNTREHEMLLIMLCSDCKRFN